MWKKIKKAAFEGILLKKGIHFIFVVFPVLLVQKIDWLFGCVVRYVYGGLHTVDKKQIMFIPFQGDFTCNPKYIAEELIRRNKKYNIVFSARKASLNRPSLYPEGVRLVEQYSADYYREIMKSKIIVANSVEFLKKPTPKKDSQIIIETWHGSLGIKKFGAKDNHGKTFVRAGQRCGKRADYILSNSDFEDDVYRDTFWKTTPILQYGHPRNDVLFSHDEELVQSIREKVIGSREDYEEICHNRFVLYAPTFRDNHSVASYNLNFDRLREALSERFGGEWSVLVRLHPTVRKKAGKYIKNRNGIDVTNYPDIQELMLISDIAITDYSSWIYDFVLTRRPGFLFATDIYTYADERGFYYPLSSTPFPIADNNDDMMENILNFNMEKYKEEVEEFLEGKGCMEDGQASKRAVDKIIELMGEAE